MGGEEKRMIATIEYKARLTWTDPIEKGLHFHFRELCAVTHEIDTETLQTTKFIFLPLPDPENIVDSVEITK